MPDEYLEMDIPFKVGNTCGDCEYCLQEDWIRCSVFEIVSDENESQDF